MDLSTWRDRVDLRDLKKVSELIAGVPLRVSLISGDGAASHNAPGNADSITLMSKCKTLGVQIFCADTRLAEHKAQRIKRLQAARPSVQIVLDQCLALARERHKSTKFAATIACLRAELDRDPLTQLLNAVAFRDAVDTALAKGVGTHSGCLLLLDLDQFKKVNDRFGHQTGDRCLQVVAKALSAFTSAQSVGRLGGDEFGLFCQSVPADPTWISQHCGRLMTKIARTTHQDATPLQTCVSIGARLFTYGDADAQKLFDDADAALYRAKRAGGNRLNIT